LEMERLGYLGFWGISWLWSIGWLRGISWLNIMGLLSISIVDLLADLLGESELNSLAGRSSKLGDALVNSLNTLLNLWNSDTFLNTDVLTGDSWKTDWLVDTSLDWLWVSNNNSWLIWGNNWGVVACLLGNLLAVVVAIAVVSISWGWLADSHHLGVAFSLECNLNSLGIGVFLLLLVRVGTDFIFNLFSALRADSSGDSVALLFVNNLLDGKLNRSTDSLKSWGADLSGFNNILN